MDETHVNSDAQARAGYRPLTLTLTGFRGIKDGLGRDEVTLDLRALVGDAQLVAIAGANGRGKTTVMDNLHPYLVMPSRAGADGLGGFSYYDHVFLPESKKELLWQHNGVQFKTQLVFRVNGKRKTEAFLLQEVEGVWKPARLADGTVSDGRVDTYEQCVQGILGSAETFFTSVFSAQGKRQLSAYKNGEIKTLLADLLGLDEVRAQGARAAETAKLLKNGLNLTRQEQARAACEIGSLQQEIRKLDDAEARVNASTLARMKATAALDRAREVKAQVGREADEAQSATKQRAELNAQRQQAAAALRDSNKRLDQRERHEAERERNLNQRKANRKRQFDERRAQLLAQRDRQRQAVAAAVRAGWAERRLPLVQSVVTLREARAKDAQTRADRATTLRHSTQTLRERLAGIEREAARTALRQGELARRFDLTSEVPCVGTDLLGRCKALSDANEAHALRPSVDAQLVAFAESRAAVQAELQGVTAELEGLDSAAEIRNEAERRLEASIARGGRFAVQAARTGELRQAQAALAATEAEQVATPQACEDETEDEAAERKDTEQACGALATERHSARETFAADSALLMPPLRPSRPRSSRGVSTWHIRLSTRAWPR